MKIFFLTVYDEETASSRTRVFQYLPHLRKSGVDASIVIYNLSLLSHISRAIASRRRPALFWNAAYRLALTVNTLRTKWIARRLPVWSRGHDILFLQKLILPSAAVNALEKYGVTTVFDMDDAIYANSASYDVPGLEEQMRITRLAIVENENTEQYFSSRGVGTLRITGPIDCDRYRPTGSAAKEGEDVTIGWIGSPMTSKNLKMIEKALLVILDEFENARLDLVGSDYTPAHPRARCIPWSLQGEVGAVSRFDVGIMPLIDDEWARGKGGYKLLQYMALGIPSVASPVGVNSEIVIDGETGFLAANDREWIESLSLLIRNSALRNRLGINARGRAMEYYSYEANTPKLLAAFSELVKGVDSPPSR